MPFKRGPVLFSFDSFYLNIAPLALVYVGSFSVTALASQS